MYRISSPIARRHTSTQVVINRTANGWMVEMPTTYKREDVADGVEQGLNAVLPKIMEVMGKLQKDPVLEKIERENEALEEQETPEPEADPKIGIQENIFVFGAFHQVLVFLEEQFPD